jgi:hypothetical protein
VALGAVDHQAGQAPVGFGRQAHPAELVHDAGVLTG